MACRILQVISQRMCFSISSCILSTSSLTCSRVLVRASVSKSKRLFSYSVASYTRRWISWSTNALYLSSSLVSSKFSDLVTITMFSDISTLSVGYFLTSAGYCGLLCSAKALAYTVFSTTFSASDPLPSVLYKHRGKATSEIYLPILNGTE